LEMVCHAVKAYRDRLIRCISVAGRSETTWGMTVFWFYCPVLFVAFFWISSIMN
jgi:hypothetical protein